MRQTRATGTFEKTAMCQTQATATSNKQKCARLEPQLLFKDRNAPDSSHSHFEKTAMSQTRATATFTKPEMAQIRATATLQSHPQVTPGSAQVIPSRPKSSPTQPQVARNNKRRYKERSSKRKRYTCGVLRSEYFFLFLGCS